MNIKFNSKEVEKRLQNTVLKMELSEKDAGGLLGDIKDTRPELFEGQA